LAEVNIIKSVTSSLESVPALLTALEKTLQTPFGWIVLAGILVWFAFNKDVLYLFRLKEEKQKRKIDSFENYLKDFDNADPETKQVIADFRNSYYFRVATEIYAEGKLRRRLIKLHDITSADVNWKTIKRALPFLSLNGDEIKIRPPKKSEKIGKYYNAFVGWLFLALSASMFIVMITVANNGLLTFLSFMCISLLLLAFALFAFSQNFPLNAASKIKKELGTIKSQSNET